MIITEEILIKKYGAEKGCEGLDYFAKHFPDGFDTETYNLDMQIWVLTKTELKEYLGWAYINEIIPLYSMRKLNLSNVNLKWSDLPKVNFSCANLINANLTHADLYGADLSSANLIGAVFRGANLTNANLSGANLTNTIVTKEYADKFNCIYDIFTVFAEG